MLKSYLTKFDKHSLEILGILLLLVEHRDGDLQKIGIGTDRVPRERLEDRSIERGNKFGEIELEVPHDYLQQFYHTLYLRVLIALEVPRVLHRLQNERKGVPCEFHENGRIGGIVGGDLEQYLEDGSQGVHQLFGEIPIVGRLLQLGEDVGEDGGEVLDGGVLVATDELYDTPDDILPVRVLLHQRHHVIGRALHYLVVALTALRKGPLRMRHQQLVIETGRCQVEQ